LGRRNYFLSIVVGVKRHGVNTHEFIALRKDAEPVNPEKLAMLERVYDEICAEAGITSGATTERNSLAQSLITASGIIDDEPTLLIFARNALAELRR